MGSTFLALHYHLVFATKQRQPFIDGQWQSRLHEYLERSSSSSSAMPAN
jgi:REP element-mobilizing transposase RayT